VTKLAPGDGAGARRSARRARRFAHTTGYRRGNDGRLTPSCDADAVREIFLRRAGGATWGDLSGYLEEHGVVGPYGNAHWTTSALSKLIAIPVYTGEARSGRHRNPEAHPAIVSRGAKQLALRTRIVSTDVECAALPP